MREGMSDRIAAIVGLTLVLGIVMFLLLYGGPRKTRQDAHAQYGELPAAGKISCAVLHHSKTIQFWPPRQDGTCHMEDIK